ncbi:4-coumarate--CoA ligase-like 7 [Senna tora]|uniref:4-coumarate--CoA ligase-like 7 n=1 Tax=Senna tora TaxID=362788 RepID=A0A834SVR3_9FABA|nr:4-coumarate--CoA ligase-like 7 [Senna tora]
MKRSIRLQCQFGSKSPSFAAGGDDGADSNKGEEAKGETNGIGSENQNDVAFVDAET